MSYVEPKRGKQTMPFILRGKDSLSDVAAAAGLGAWIPACPPVDAEVNKQRQNGHPRRVEIWKERQARSRLAARGVHRGYLDLQGVDPAYRANRKHGQHYNHAHLEHELKQVGHQNSPQP